MKTDEEINKIIHERIMGECWHESTESVVCDKCGEVFFTPLGGDDPHPDYVNSIKQAFAVVEKLKSEWQWFSDNQDKQSYHVQFAQRRVSPKYFEALEESLPKAICLAAMAVIEEKG